MEGENLESLREKRLRKALAEQQQAAQLEAQKKSLLRNVLTPEAYERLMNVKLANPDLYNQMVSILSYALQNGKLSGKVDEGQVRSILVRLTEKREPSISLKRKGSED